MNVCELSAVMAARGDAHTLVLANETVWIAKGPKGQVQNHNAQDALADYIEKFGKRGQMRLYSNKREGDMLVFDSSCKSYKGTVSEVAHALTGVSINKREGNVLGHLSGW